MNALEHLAQQGFSLRSFESFPRHLGVVKYECVALLELTPEGKWKQFGAAGYLLDGQIALLVEHQARPTFVYKSRQLPAEGPLLEDFRLFQSELRSILDTQ